MALAQGLTTITTPPAAASETRRHRTMAETDVPTRTRVMPLPELIKAMNAGYALCFASLDPQRAHSAVTGCPTTSPSDPKSRKPILQADEAVVQRLHSARGASMQETQRDPLRSPT
jgi:hypothetical protein